MTGTGEGGPGRADDRQRASRGEAPTVDAAARRSLMRVHPLSLALRDLMLAGDEVEHVMARRLELNPTDFAAMNHLASGAEGVGPVELGARLGISSGSATGLVDRLESAGHLRRERHPSDRRRLVLAPTESTIKNIVEVLRPMLADLDALGEQFNDDEQRVVARYLREAAQRLRAYAAAQGATPTVRVGDTGGQPEASASPPSR